MLHVSLREKLFLPVVEAHAPKNNHKSHVQAFALQMSANPFDEVLDIEIHFADAGESCAAEGAEKRAISAFARSEPLPGSFMRIAIFQLHEELTKPNRLYLFNSALYIDSIGELREVNKCTRPREPQNR